MKIMRMGVSAALTAMLLIGGAATLNAYADETASVQKYLVSLEEPANAQWDSGQPVFVSIAEDVAERMDDAGIEVVESYTSVGVIVAEMTRAQADALKNKPGVLDVSKNREVRPAATQTSAPWHLDRIDQQRFHHRFRNGEYTYGATGNGVTAYVLDTGIIPDWPDIKGRVLGGADFSGDGHGWKGCEFASHGTKVATVIGGKKYGVAKNTKFVSLRVFPCYDFGTGDMIIGALDWVMKYGKKPAVVNMSLSFQGWIEPVVDEAVERVIDAGFPVAVAAGNEGIDACDNTPSHIPAAVTVAAIDIENTESSFSNYGSCVDVYAPGEDIQVHSDQMHNDTGTSFASPHGAGAMAQYLELYPDATPAQIHAAIVNTSFKNEVKGATSGTPNRILNALDMSRKPAAWTMSHAGGRVIGTVSNTWGIAPAGATRVWTEVMTPKGWSRSQTRTPNANGYVVIPLTYGFTLPGTYTYRVGASTPQGTVYTNSFAFFREQLYVSSVGRKKIRQVTNMWGTVPTAANRRVETYALVNNRWSRSQTRIADSRGYAAIPLTYGASTPGTYTFRAAYDTPYGKVWSAPFTLTRYR